MARIPFNKPFAVGTEYGYMRDAVERMHISGDGHYTKKCQTLLEEILGVPNVLLTTSCTHALEMAALLLDIQPGDEVIVPSFTFVSTANAFALRGAKIVFADGRSDTLISTNNTPVLNLHARNGFKFKNPAVTPPFGVGLTFAYVRMNVEGAIRECFTGHEAFCSKA